MAQYIFAKILIIFEGRKIWFHFLKEVNIPCVHCEISGKTLGTLCPGARLGRCESVFPISTDFQGFPHHPRMEIRQVTLLISVGGLTYPGLQLEARTSNSMSGVCWGPCHLDNNHYSGTLRVSCSFLPHFSHSSYSLLISCVDLLSNGLYFWTVPFIRSHFLLWK